MLLAGNRIVSDSDHAMNQLRFGMEQAQCTGIDRPDCRAITREGLTALEDKLGDRERTVSSMRIRVLILDDDEGIRLLLRQVLGMRGCEVLTFAHPGLCPLMTSDGCQCPAGQACADLIIADLHMPGWGGLEFVEHLRHGGCKASKMVLVSGDWSAAEAEKARSMGCEVLSKPFSLEAINGLLEECARNVDGQRVLADWVEGRPTP